VKKELDHQIQKVKDHGINISHLDSHQHIHMLPEILKITLNLAKKYSIPAIRYPQEKKGVWMINHGARVSRFIQLIVLNSFCRIAKGMDIMHTDYFIGFLFSGHLNTHNLTQMLRHLPSHGTCELMCHPGMDDPDSKYLHWGYSWPEEMKALIDPSVVSFVKSGNINLINYNQIVA
jgi:predicted glycoside hydrolase/deacetylase ChbG (UPF0249 family)